jgi:ATP-dependent helicase Lhr and Lhr-like helicase
LLRATGLLHIWERAGSSRSSLLARPGTWLRGSFWSGGRACRTRIVRWLVDTGHLETDSGMLFVGPEAERRFGRRHFMVLSVFAGNPEFAVLHGRTEIGSLDPMQLTCNVDGLRVITLAGLPWKVDYVDCKRRCCYVEATETRGTMRWHSRAPLTFAMCPIRREVLLGRRPAVRLTGRASRALASGRAERATHVLGRSVRAAGG